jgi:hypothetical protein
MDPDFFKNTILPLTTNLHHATTAITTPDNELGWASEIQDVRGPDGKLVFKTYMSGGACALCRKLGKPEECTHQRRPKWKDAKSTAKIRAVLGDDVNVFNREVMGTVTKDNIHIFEEYTTRLWKSPPHIPTLPLDSLSCFIDSAGGGTASDFVIETQAIDDGRDVVSIVVDQLSVQIHPCHLLPCMQKVVPYLLGCLERLLVDIALFAERLHCQQRCKDPWPQQIRQRVGLDALHNGLVELLWCFRLLGDCEIENCLEFLHNPLDIFCCRSVQVLTHGCAQIVGVDAMSESKDPTAVDRMLINHVLLLREVPIYRDAVIFMGIEPNQGGWLQANRYAALFQPNPADPGQMTHHLSLTGGRSLGPIWIYNKDMDGGGDAGVWTGEAQKKGGAEQMLESLRRGNMRFAKDFVTQHKDPHMMRRKIIDQMKKFRKAPKPLTDPAFQTPKFAYTGKSGNSKDDVVVCIQLNMYWTAVLHASKRYREICNRLGMKRV